MGAEKTVEGPQRTIARPHRTVQGPLQTVEDPLGTVTSKGLVGPVGPSPAIDRSFSGAQLPSPRQDGPCGPLTAQKPRGCCRSRSPAVPTTFDVLGFQRLKGPRWGG
ncbi:hypothetical protein M885DRAFT_146882 [Pelagophyceae sp. CCMP2097]|nr:hypothetical protein M885DRAFT_146882 [Pelagophyceae sp. CCMP2097]